MAGIVATEARTKEPSNTRITAYKGANLSKLPKRDLTQEEKSILKETDDEFKRKNFWKRIFPSVDFLYYKQFFEEERPLNFLLDAKLMA